MLGIIWCHDFVRNADVHLIIEQQPLPLSIELWRRLAYIFSQSVSYLRIGSLWIFRIRKTSLNFGNNPHPNRIDEVWQRSMLSEWSHFDIFVFSHSHYVAMVIIGWCGCWCRWQWWWWWHISCSSCRGRCSARHHSNCRYVCSRRHRLVSVVILFSICDAKWLLFQFLLCSSIIYFSYLFFFYMCCNV